MSTKTSISSSEKRYYVWPLITLLIGITVFSSAAWMRHLLISIAATSWGLIAAYAISTALAVTVLVCEVLFSIKVWLVAAEVGVRDKHFRAAAIYRLIAVTFLTLGTVALLATVASGYSQISAQLNPDNPLNALGDWKLKGDVLGYSGNISNSFLIGLRVQLEKNPNAKILEIDSNGGYMDVASAAAKILNQSKVTVAVPIKCQSSCAYLWAISDKQAIAPKAVLGFHRPFTLTSFGDILYVINTESIRDAFERMNFPSSFINEAFKSNASSMVLIHGYELISRGVSAAYVGDKAYDYAAFGRATHDFLGGLVGTSGEIYSLLPSATDFSKKASEILSSEQDLPDVTVNFSKLKSLAKSGFLDGSTPENAKRSATLLSGLAVATSEDFTAGRQVGQIMRSTSKAEMSAYSELAIFHLTRIHAAINQLSDAQIHDVLTWIANSAIHDSHALEGYQSLGGCGTLAAENWTYFLTLSNDQTQQLEWNDLLYITEFLGGISRSLPVHQSSQKVNVVPHSQVAAKDAFGSMTKKTGWSALATCANLAEYIHGDMQKNHEASLQFLSKLTDTTAKPLEQCQPIMRPGGNLENICHNTYSPS